MKDELKEDKIMIKQNKEFHSHKENMRQLQKKELELLLIDNQQEIPEGYDAVSINTSTLLDTVKFNLKYFTEN